jgi:hypothetical protein
MASRRGRDLINPRSKRVFKASNIGIIVIPNSSISTNTLDRD